MGKKNDTAALAHKKVSLFTDMKRHKWLYLMVLPGVIWMIIFCYLPMGGLVMASFVSAVIRASFPVSSTVSL